VMNRKRRSRTAICLSGMAATMAAAALHAAPALATAGSGQAAINVASHSKGRTLSGQGVKLIAGEGATGKAGKLSLPIDELNPGTANPTAQSTGALRFKRGKRTLALTGIHFDFVAGALAGKLGGTEMPVFTLGTPPTVNSIAGSIALSEGKLALTADAAKAIKQKLGLAKALRSDGVGMLWFSAQAAPTHAAPRPVTSGTANWGVLASWRSYVLGNFGPGSVGTIGTEGGATSTGTLSEPGAFFSFPAASGSFEKGLYGAADKLSLQTAGAVVFKKPGHCIIEVKFSDIKLAIDGTQSSLSLNSVSDIDKPSGMTCEDQPPLITPGVNFATLNLTGSPAFSADGNTVTWTAIPSALTAAGSTAWGAGPPYVAGKALDAVSITVGLG
jgi:Htaa protein